MTYDIKFSHVVAAPVSMQYGRILHRCRNIFVYIYSTLFYLWNYMREHYLDRTLCTHRGSSHVVIILHMCVYSFQNTITRMMNFHNPALVRTVTFNFAESYQNVTMLRILMSDAQHKHVSHVVLT